MAMVSNGVDIDVVSGQPRETLADERREASRQRAHQQVAQANRLRASLASGEGSLLRESMTNALADRIELLMKSDPPCQVLLQLLSQWTHELSVGSRMAESLMREIEEH